MSNGGLYPSTLAAPSVGVAGAAAIEGWYIDPQNSSGNASDANPGTSALAPLLTIAEWNRRIGAQALPNNGQPTIVTFLSAPDASGTYSLGANIINGGTLAFVGAKTVLQTYTISARTVWAESTGIIGFYTLTGAPDLSSYVGKMVRISASATPANVGLKGILAKDLGSGVFRCNFGDQSTGAVGEPSVGDTIQIYDLTRIDGDVFVWADGTFSSWSAGGTIYFVDLDMGQAASHSVSVTAPQVTFDGCIIRGLDVNVSAEYCALNACATYDCRSYGFLESNASTHLSGGGECLNARGGAGVIHVKNRCLIQGGGPTAGHLTEGPGTIMADGTIAFADYGAANADGATALAGGNIITYAYMFGRDGSGSGATCRVYNGSAILHASGKGPTYIGTRSTNASNIGGTTAASAGGTGLATVPDATVSLATIIVNQ